MADSTRPADLIRDYTVDDGTLSHKAQIDLQLRMAQQNAKTNKLAPRDQSESEPSVPVSPFDDDWGDLYKIDLKEIDFDSGDDDEVILAMYLQLVGGRDQVIEHVKAEWQDYQEYCKEEH